MGIREEIAKYINRKTQSAEVIRFLLEHEFITCNQIIKIAHSNCPHSIIRDIRKTFGYDFVKDELIKYTKTRFTPDGKPFKQTETCKRYFLNFEGV